MNRTDHSTPLAYSSNTQPSGGRGNGLLGKMFRKGPPKQPKLNPMGISSKDFFSSGPRSAPAPAPGDYAVSRSTKLTRKLSTLSPAPGQSAAPGNLSEGVGDSRLIVQTQPHTPSSRDETRRRRPSMLRLNTSAPTDEEKASRHKRRGSLWRAKLGFTNVRRPETRRQRHQSFDSNAIDIAAHPRIFAESPLVSLPVAAPASTLARSSSQLLADSHLGTTPHSAVSATGLATIDREFLLTIQRNSALEARRQRRRETRRSTLSFLSPTAADTDCQTADSALRAHQLGDVPEGCSSAAPLSNPPLALSEPHPTCSSISARSSTDGVPSPLKLVLSELEEATVKESVARAALASSTSGASLSPVTPPAPALCSLPSSAWPDDDNCAVPPVPPLPHHLANYAHAPRPETARGPELPRIVPDPRRVRASASIYPAAVHLDDRPPATSLARTLLSTPPTLDLAASQRVDHDWDADTTQLQRYSLGPVSVNPASAVDLRGPFQHFTDEGAAPAQSVFVRKFSHPEAQLQHTSGAPHSPVHTPDVLSKSATNLNLRASVDNSVSVPKHGLGRLFSSSPSSRKTQQPPRLPTLSANVLLSPSPPSSSPPPSSQQQPLSPAVSSLVGDPNARRRIRDQLASSRAFDRLLSEDDEFTMAISLTPIVAGTVTAAPRRK
ncbi:hypothetical protein COEREDRAFT_98745 [Coemansia reversa NRRL 1564]|uniref:Uncharacterized protein n=1 Tax=Coemansia reversa (strain ATCC 12441 / NRRL 1564) TaxID=763665 RepID=A0A2G5B6T4_COERN|nr:hypothetical protein COEREDRAFT_98745 [Coemansia reversa NRRL 1564]|eukprot:PIA14725.1 hypothetical protein COEREDRAFT_98745 [Coemansia reversa NRRL 1564]